jgi:uncharacterized protein (DUF1786 family)
VYACTCAKNSDVVADVDKVHLVVKLEDVPLAARAPGIEDHGIHPPADDAAVFSFSAVSSMVRRPFRPRTMSLAAKTADADWRRMRSTAAAARQTRRAIAAAATECALSLSLQLSEDTEEQQ